MACVCGLMWSERKAEGMVETLVCSNPDKYEMIALKVLAPFRNFLQKCPRSKGRLDRKCSHLHVHYNPHTHSTTTSAPPCAIPVDKSLRWLHPRVDHTRTHTRCARRLSHHIGIMQTEDLRLVHTQCSIEI